MHDDNLPKTLRAILRSRTRAQHDVLDAAFAHNDLTDLARYRAFLQFQYDARLPIEAWIREHCPVGIRPPEQARLIEGDLIALGTAADTSTVAFGLAADADPIGVAWALGGSSLGNRSMLEQMKKENARTLPTAFLGDPGMTEFWRELRPQLEIAVDRVRAGRTVASARAVFDCFIAAHDARKRKLAA